MEVKISYDDSDPFARQHGESDLEASLRLSCRVPENYRFVPVALEKIIFVQLPDWGSPASLAQLRDTFEWDGFVWNEEYRIIGPVRAVDSYFKKGDGYKLSNADIARLKQERGTPLPTIDDQDRLRGVHHLAEGVIFIPFAVEDSIKVSNGKDSISLRALRVLRNMSDQDCFCERGGKIFLLSELSIQRANRSKNSATAYVLTDMTIIDELMEQIWPVKNRPTHTQEAALEPIKPTPSPDGAGRLNAAPRFVTLPELRARTSNPNTTAAGAIFTLMRHGRPLPAESTPPTPAAPTAAPTQAAAAPVVKPDAKNTSPTK
jgi:hypothetical protein